MYDRIGLGSAQLGQLGGVVQLAHLGVDLVGHLALDSLRLKPLSRILARGVVGGDQHHAAKFLGRPQTGPRLRAMVVLGSWCQKVGVALRARQLAGAWRCPTGTAPWRQTAWAPTASATLLAMGPVNRSIFSRCIKRSTSCLAWSGLPRHVGLHKFCGLAAQLAAQLLDGQRSNPSRAFGAGAGERARHVQRHPHLDRRALGMGWGAGECGQRGPSRQVRCAAQRCNAERAERGAIFRSYRENVKRERDANATALQEPDWAQQRAEMRGAGAWGERPGRAARRNSLR